MAYEGFAFYYDALNEDANYDDLSKVIGGFLEKYGVGQGVVADLGCGTGELTLRLASQGYDMIAIDASTDMLNVLRDKMAAQSQNKILLLCQPLEELDLFGTIRGAVSTFDTFNHLCPEQLKKSIEKISLFMERDGVLIFDMNTPYKHEQILADHVFVAESASLPGVVCEWENQLKTANKSTDIYLEFRKNNKIIFSEEFTEYYYNYSELLEILENCSFGVETILDGETFQELKEDSQRMLVVAKRL